MGLTVAGFALFLHITLVIVGLAVAAVLHAALLMMRAAGEVAAVRPWPRVIAVLEASLPLAALLILLTGAWLVYLSGGEFAWTQGWLLASLVGLVVVEAAGGAVAPRSRALRRGIAEAAPGPIRPELRRRILDPVLWVISTMGSAVFLAIVFVMVVKPSGLWSAVVIAAVGVLGGLGGLEMSRPRPPVETGRPEALSSR